MQRSRLLLELHQECACGQGTGCFCVLSHSFVAKHSFFYTPQKNEMLPGFSEKKHYRKAAQINLA